MSTLKQLVDETTNIKNELKTCHTNLSNVLTEKGVVVLPNDKVLDLVGKVDDINNKSTYDENINENINSGYFDNTKIENKKLTLVDSNTYGYRISLPINIVEHDAIRLSWDGEGDVYIIKNGVEEIQQKNIDIDKITDASVIKIKQVLTDDTKYIENFTLTFIKYLTNTIVNPLQDKLYSEGKEFEEATGGYGSRVVNMISLSKQQDHLRLSNTGFGYFNGIFYTQNLINLNGFNKIKFDAEISSFAQGSNGTTKCIFGVSNTSTINSFNSGTVSFTAQRVISSNYNRGIIEVDISNLKDNFHAFCSCYGYDGSSKATVKVYTIELEVGNI